MKYGLIIAVLLILISGCQKINERATEKINETIDKTVNENMKKVDSTLSNVQKEIDSFSTKTGRNLDSLILQIDSLKKRSEKTIDEQTKKLNK